MTKYPDSELEARVKAKHLDAICESVRQGPRLLTWDASEGTYGMQEADGLMERLERAEAEVARLRTALGDIKLQVVTPWFCARLLPAAIAPIIDAALASDRPAEIVCTQEEVDRQ